MIVYYKGRKIVAVTRRGRDHRKIVVRLNGIEVRGVPCYRDPDAAQADAVKQIKYEIDLIDDSPPDGRWGIEWYDPATVELCAEGTHAQQHGGPCPHPACKERDALPKTPCRKCGTPVGRYTTCGAEWTIAHRAPGSRLLCGMSNVPDRPGFESMPDEVIKRS
jgi:hypothetical protein